MPKTAFSDFSESDNSYVFKNTAGAILRGTRNLSFGIRRLLLRTFEIICILLIIFNHSNIYATKLIC